MDDCHILGVFQSYNYLKQSQTTYNNKYKHQMPTTSLGRERRPTMDTTPAEIMTIEEAAVFLRIPVSSMYRLAQLGKVPATKVGRHWRFYRPAIVEWINHGNLAPEGKMTSPEKPEKD
jgi:excisionase family DNA binding protein